MTIQLSVPDMSCGHCVRTITEAIESVDAQAKVTVDLGTRHVSIESETADAPRMAAALEAAGYPSHAAN